MEEKKKKPVWCIDYSMKLVKALLVGVLIRLVMTIVEFFYAFSTLLTTIMCANKGTIADF